MDGTTRYIDLHFKFTFTFTFSERKTTGNNQTNPCNLPATDGTPAEGTFPSVSYKDRCPVCPDQATCEDSFPLKDCDILHYKA